MKNCRKNSTQLLWKMRKRYTQIHVNDNTFRYAYNYRHNIFMKQSSEVDWLTPCLIYFTMAWIQIVFIWWDSHWAHIFVEKLDVLCSRSLPYHGKWRKMLEETRSNHWGKNRIKNYRIRSELSDVLRNR